MSRTLFDEPQQADAVEEKVEERKLKKPSQKIMVDNKDLSKQPTIDQLLLAAVQQGVDVETLDKLLDLKERIDAKNAEKAFNEAMANFQGECPLVPKNTNGAFGRFASLEDIEKHIKEPLARNGLSYTWNSKLINDGKERVTYCTVTHILGHKETAEFQSEILEVTVGKSGKSTTNNIQRQGSTVSYGRRYSLMLALGIVAEGEDDDGNAADKKETISEEQKREIEKLVGSADEILYKKILEFYGIESLDRIPADRFRQCINKINRYKMMKKKARNDDKGTEAKR